MKKRMIYYTIMTGMIALYWTFNYLIENNKVRVPYEIQEIYGVGIYFVYLYLIVLVIDLIQKMRISKSVLKKLSATIWLVGMIAFHSLNVYYLAHGYQVGGCLSISEKSYQDGRASFRFKFHEDVIVTGKCKKEIYDQIVTHPDVAYSVSFRYNSLRRDKGVLERITLEDHIDNRHKN